MYDSNTPRPFDLGSILRQALRQNRRKTVRETPRGQVLRFETLETRSLLSITLLPTISGTVFHDLNGNGVDNGEPGLQE